jgi:flagellar motor switch protein FliM
MDKVLNQREIDALFRAAQHKASPIESPIHDDRKIIPFELDQTGRITKSQVQSVSMLFDSFARKLSHSVGAYLRVMFESHLVSVEQISFMEFLQRLPENAYLAAIRFRPLEGRGLIHLDLTMAFPMIDLLLGGNGKPVQQERELTDIEAQVLESIVRILAREMKASWNPIMEMDIDFDERQQQAQVLQLLPSTERVISLLMDVRTPDVRGQMTLVFPAVVSSALLRKLSQHSAYRKPAGTPNVPEKVRNNLLHCRFPVELNLPSLRMSARDLMNMEPGTIINFHMSQSDPVKFRVAGRNLFSAFPACQGDLRAARLHEPISVTESALQPEA